MKYKITHYIELQVWGNSSARLQHWGETHIENLHKDSTIWGSSRNCKVTLPKRNPGMLKQHLLSMKLLLLLSRKEKKMLMMLILIFLFLCWNLFVLLGLQRTVCRHLQLHVKPLEGIMWGIYAKTIVNLLINALLFYAFHSWYLWLSLLFQGPYKAPLPTLLFSDFNRRLLVLQNVAEEGFYR